MKNFIKTWAYRFDATLGPCLIVYAVMALINAQCIFQTKSDEFTGMGAWFTAKHLDFVFLGAFIAIILIHVLFISTLAAAFNDSAAVKSRTLFFRTIYNILYFFSACGYSGSFLADCTEAFL